MFKKSLKNHSVNQLADPLNPMDANSYSRLTHKDATEWTVPQLLLLFGGTNIYSLILTVDNENINYRFQSVFWAWNNNHRSWRKGIRRKPYSICRCREQKGRQTVWGQTGGENEKGAEQVNEKVIIRTEKKINKNTKEKKRTKEWEWESTNASE